MLCFRKFLVAKKFMDKREGGVSRFSVENFLSHSAENFRREILYCCINFGYRKSLEKRGEYQLKSLARYIYSNNSFPRYRGLYVGFKHSFKTSMTIEIERPEKAGRYCFKIKNWDSRQHFLLGTGTGNLIKIIFQTPLCFRLQYL